MMLLFVKIEANLNEWRLKNGDSIDQGECFSHQEKKDIENTNLNYIFTFIFLETNY
jgi:hypothetical protein